MAEKSKRRTKRYSFWTTIFQELRVMRYWERGTWVCGGVCRIGHLVHVAILAPHWGVVLANSLCRWYYLYPGGRVFLQRKSLGLHQDLNPVIFSITHTQPCFPHFIFFDNKVNCQRGPKLEWWLELRRSKVQLLDLIGAMDRRKMKCPLKYLAKGKKIP